MSLLDDLATATDTKPGVLCATGVLLSSLDEAEADAVRKAIAGPRYATTISAILKANGHDVSDKSLLRHRAKRCGCR